MAMNSLKKVRKTLAKGPKILYLCGLLRNNHNIRKMKVTIVNRTKEEKKYTRVELDEFVSQLKDGTYHHHYIRDFSKDVCFAAEWQKQNGELKAKAYNPLILLS